MNYAKLKSQPEKTASFRLPEMLLRKLDQHCAESIKQGHN